MPGNTPGNGAITFPNIQIMQGRVYAPPWFIGADVAFRVLDNSMTPHIKTGFIVFITRRKKVQDGQMGAAEVDGKTYLSRIFRDNRGFILVFDNRNFERLEVLTADHRVSIIGPVAGWLSPSEQERIQKEDQEWRLAE